MWIFFSLICMVMLTVADIIGKKAVGFDESAPLKLRMSVMAASFLSGLIIYALRLGESGLAPWTVALKHPTVIIAACFIVVSEFLYLFSLKYIGMSIMEAISGLEGITLFSGLFLVNLLSGKLSEVKDMLIPERLILICVILVFAFLLPNIETITNKKSVVAEEKIKERHKIAIGILIALAAVIIGACDSLISDVLLGSGDIGTIDYIMTGYFLSVVPLPVFCIILFVKNKKKNKKSTYKIVNGYSALYTVLFLGQMFVGLLATSIDAVRSEIMYLTYPVISILGAKIILKEKYTSKQNACIWIITVAAIAFCVIDYLI